MGYGDNRRSPGQVLYIHEDAAGNAVADVGQFLTVEVGGITEAGYKDDAGNGGKVTVFTKDGAINAAAVDHNALANLTTGDPHTLYALIAGRAAEDLTVQGGLIVATAGPTGARQHTLPDIASDTVALLAAAQTLTTKSVDLASNTLTGTAAEFATACSDDTFAYISDKLDVFAATTSAELAGVISDETGSSLLVFNTSPTLVTPDVNGGTVDSLTAFSIRSTGAAFDLTLATATAFSAGRTLTIDPGDAARTVTLSGNPTLDDWFNQDVKSTADPTFGNLTITSFAANWTNAGRTIADLGIVTTADINGGTIDGVTIATSSLTTPTIGDFTNAPHDHSNAAGGAQLTFTASLSDTPGSITANRVLHGNAGGTALTDGEEVNILSTGEFLVGAAALTQASNFIEFREDANAFTLVRLYNITSGTAAQAGFTASAGPVDNVLAGLVAVSAGFTPANGVQAAESLFSASGSQNPNAVLMTFGTGVIRFVTNGIADGVNSERAQINGTAFQPGADDRIALGVPGTGFSDAAFASGAVIDIGNGNYTATHSAGVLTFSGEVEIDGDLNHDGTNVGFYGVAPVARSAGWTITNDATDRTFDADTVAVAELADVVATLITDLAATGVIGASA